MIKQLFLIAFFFLLLLTPAYAFHSTPGTLYVNDTCTALPTGTLTPTITPSGTPPVTPTGTQGTQANPFCTIQEAVDHAQNGDTIRVADGTYEELVIVNKSVRLLGAQADRDARTRLDTPATEPESVVGTPNGAFEITVDNVMINGFTIQGVTTGLGAGIHTTSATAGYLIYNNIIQNNVMGLYLNSDGGPVSRVRRNAFLNNDAAGAASGNGIYSDQGLQDTEISRNEFVGHPNGAITIAATTTTVNDDINIERNQQTTGGGFLNLYKASDIIISRNEIVLTSDGHGMYLGGGNINVEISRNEVTSDEGGWSGIRTYDEGFGANQIVEISRNTLSGLLDNGIKIGADSFTGNQNILSRNTINFNNMDGILIESGNTNLRIERNSMQGNNGFDAHDLTGPSGGKTAGTANTWYRNECVTSSPVGLCYTRPRIISPTVTPTATTTPTNTPTNTPTSTPTNTPTNTPTLTPTSTPTDTPTPTP